jgi:hypothetical protein
VDINKIMPPVVLLLLILATRWANRGGLDRLTGRAKARTRAWTSGWTSWWTSGRREAGHGVQPQASDPQDAEDGDGPAMSSPDVQPGPLMPPRVIPAAALEQVDARPTLQRYEAPGPPETVQPGETRLHWVRRVTSAGLLPPSEIDRIGAEKWGVAERTIRRDREQASKDAPREET